jgi:hypothetical protein
MMKLTFSQLSSFRQDLLTSRARVKVGASLPVPSFTLVYRMVSLQTQALHGDQLLNYWFANVDIYKPQVYYYSKS